MRRGMRRKGHERTGRSHERNDYRLGGDESDLRLVRTRNEKRRMGGGDEKDRCHLRTRCSYQDVEKPKKELAACPLV
jgi:nitric oxide reductase activation protein